MQNYEHLLAVMFFNFKVGVEVQHNLLVGLWCTDDPLTVLMGRVVIRVPR